MKKASDFPDLTEKKALRLSPSTTLRRREPTNEFMPSKLPNMVWDYSRQMSVWPDRLPNALIEATQQHTSDRYRTMNKSGQPFALGLQVGVGGAPDVRGNADAMPAKVRMLK